MNDQATRKDIDEVISILKDFMGQVSVEFAEVNNKIIKLDQKYNHLSIL